jgi:hypothetical protein
MDDLATFVDAATRRPVHGEVSRFARTLAEARPGALAVLAYGSALRDLSPQDTLIDYYVLVDSTQNLGGGALLRWLGERIPPNVYYAEQSHNGVTLRAKYAVMTIGRFAEGVSRSTSNPYLWARFAQPSRIVWLSSEQIRAEVVAALAEAARTAFGHGVYLSAATPWQELFKNTYRTELRPESGNRAALIVEADKDYYASLPALLAGTAPHPSSWRAKRIFGKLWALARLGKAAFTFQGGADYAAWKIARHSGVTIEVTEWQRRHPFLAGLLLLPKLLGKKGLK